ncbi:MAG: hypothetical protein ACRC40_04165, partial [Fusobacteriaceae bacterium]
MQEKKKGLFRKIFFREEREVVSKVKTVFNYLLVDIFFISIFVFAFKNINYNYSWRDIIETYYYKFIMGFAMTVF